MRGERIEPGASINPGTPVVPRLAATVIVMRGDTETLEVLLAKRTPAARFMGGAWVFPGGSVSAEDGEGEPGLRAAAIREVAEEVGISFTAETDELVPFSNWITPEASSIRFDTWFFLAAAPPGVEPEVDGSEIVEARWFAPQRALSAAARDELLLVFPTIKHLERLSRFASMDELLRHARGRTVEPVQPKVLDREGEVARIVLPGEPGYDD
jgi:8-oxo-dGTP pyrophosphatase MutT (NUDIX family)